MSSNAIPPTPPARRWGIVFAAIWLFFLADPMLEAWSERDTVAGVVGGLVTIAFAAVYMTIWFRLRRDRNDFTAPPSLGRAWAYLGVLLVLGAVMIALLGETGTASLVYCAVAAVMLFPLRGAALVVLALVGAVVALHAVNPAWHSPVGLVFSVLAASLAVFGVRTMMARNIDLVRAEKKNAELAVENERTRFARDLHDILGHSLTVITVKAELANRLLDVDVERARAELTDLERLSRDALADVRRAVEGYRELTLPGELARARNALAAAEIEASCRTRPTRCPRTCASCSHGPCARASRTSSGTVAPPGARCGWARMPQRWSTTASGREPWCRVWPRGVPVRGSSACGRGLPPWGAP